MPYPSNFGPFSTAKRTREAERYLITYTLSTHLVFIKQVKSAQATYLLLKDNFYKTKKNPKKFVQRHPTSFRVFQADLAE